MSVAEHKPIIAKNQLNCYIISMNDISKFVTDLQKAVKFDRQNNGGKSDYKRIKSQIKNLFLRCSGCPGDLPSSVFEYWENEYILNSSDYSYEPSEKNQYKLAAFLAFLENSDEFQDEISDSDWDELERLVNFEAEELPVDVLQDLMKILVSKGAY